MEAIILGFVSVALVASLVYAIWACLWGCRKTEPKNELLGLAGMVKLTNPDEAYSNSQNGLWPASTSNATAAVSDSQSTKRCSTSANRSLPDLPVDASHVRHPEGSVLWETQEVGGDTGSELYATVEENARPAGTGQTRSKKLVPRELSSESKEESESTREGISPNCQPHVLDDDGFPTYARLRQEHPYDKLKKCEHPYAQVRPPSTRELDTEQSISDRSDALDPVPPPRTRKSLTHGSSTPPQVAVTVPSSGNGAESPRSLHSGGGPCTPPESTSDIAAAVAISGRISASQDLPYMTPPIASSQTQTVQHFSGDSQDSSKGYTSISVREPLANIQRQRPHDSHYATVSDDSDEMYAAIEDPSQVYTSGSETYAQIQPLALVSLSTLPPHPHSPETMDSDTVASTSTQTVQSGSTAASSQLIILAPQPPSVDSLKHVAQAHSRQASSSSAASSVANLGSPKPEKRPANSPLPPPPANLASPEGGCSLEDMYAKVIKKKRGSSEETDKRSQEADSPRSQPSSPQRRFSTPLPTEVSSCNDPGYETVSASEATMPENAQSHHTGYETVKKVTSSDLDPNYEELQVAGIDPGYAHIRGRSETVEPEYARISREQAVQKHDVKVEPDYASISRSQKIISEGKVSKSGEIDDPGYEQVRLQKQNNTGEDSDQENPGYEQVHARISEVKKSAAIDNDPGYEQVRLAGSSHDCFSTDQDYEGLTLSQSDPNYETVHNEEPNYESVQYYNNSIKDGSLHKFDLRDEATNPLLGSSRTKSGVQ